MLSLCFQVSSHVAGSHSPSLCPRCSHPRGKSKAQQQRHSASWVWRSRGEEAEAAALIHTCVGTGDPIYSVSAGWGRRMAGKPLGPLPALWGAGAEPRAGARCCCQLRLWKIAPDFLSFPTLILTRTLPRPCLRLFR